MAGKQGMGKEKEECEKEWCALGNVRSSMYVVWNRAVRIRMAESRGNANGAVAGGGMAAAGGNQTRVVAVAGRSASGGCG